MIERNEYLSKLISVKENGFPKIITGVRRCGKSYLLKEIYRNYLLNNGVLDSQIIIIELDDIRNGDMFPPLIEVRASRSRILPNPVSTS